MQRKLRICEGLTLALGILTPVLTQGESAYAQANPGNGAPASTMDALARSVVDTNPEIVAQREQVRIARARLQSAEAGFLPSVQGNGLVQKRRIDVKDGGNGDARFIAAQAAVEARVRVFDGDRTYNSVQVAKAEVASAEAALQGLISDVLLDLLTSAADVHSERKIRQFSQQQSDAINEQLRATSRRLEFGEATKTDESLAKARLASSQAGILSATESLNVSGNRFKAVSGQSATVVPPLPALAPLPASLTQAQTLAEGLSPRIRVALLNAEAGRIGVNFAKGALFPQLDAVGGYEFLTGGVTNLFTGKLPNDRDALFAGIELNVPIFQPREFAEMRRARAVRDQRLAQTDFAARTVSQEVATAWTQWQSAKSIIVASEAAVAAIADAAEGIKKESIGGNRTLAEVLDAQNELLAARISLERAIRNEFVARASVLATTGKLSVEAVLPGSASNGTDLMTKPEPSALGGRPVQAQEIVSTTLPDRPAISPLGVKVLDNAGTSSSANIALKEPPQNPNRPQPSALGLKTVPTQ